MFSKLWKIPRGYRKSEVGNGYQLNKQPTRDIISKSFIAENIGKQPHTTITMSQWTMKQTVGNSRNDPHNTNMVSLKQSETVGNSRNNLQTQTQYRSNSRKQSETVGTIHITQTWYLSNSRKQSETVGTIYKHKHSIVQTVGNSRKQSETVGNSRKQSEQSTNANTLSFKQSETVGNSRNDPHNTNILSRNKFNNKKRFENNTNKSPWNSWKQLVVSMYMFCWPLNYLNYIISQQIQLFVKKKQKTKSFDNKTKKSQWNSWEQLETVGGLHVYVLLTLDLSLCKGWNIMKRC